MYNGGEERLDTEEWTKNQDSIRKLNPDDHREKDTTKQNSDGMGKNKGTNKQDNNMSDQH